jgi:hypothetical protein
MMVKRRSYGNLVFLLFFFSSSASLFTQKKNQSSLYLGTIEIGSGIRENGERFRTEFRKRETR